MGKNKGIGITILVLGVVLLLAGLGVKYVVLPGQAKFPADVDSTRNYEGELAVMMNAAALETGDLGNLFLKNIPVTIERTVKTLEVGGNNGAIVSDHAVMSSPQGPLAESLSIYAIDRTTMDSIEDFSGDVRITPREGIVIGWPIGSEGRDYIGWNGDTQQTVVLAYANPKESESIAKYNALLHSQYFFKLHESDVEPGESQIQTRAWDIASTEWIFNTETMLELTIPEIGAWDAYESIEGEPCENCWETTRQYFVRAQFGDETTIYQSPPERANVVIIVAPDENDPSKWVMRAMFDLGI